MTTHQKVSTINVVIKFGTKDFKFTLVLVLESHRIPHSSPLPLTLFSEPCPCLCPWCVISTSHGLRLTPPSSQVVPHSLRIAIWTSVHREDGFISVAINDRLEKTEGQERDNRSNETKEDNSTGNEQMFSRRGPISDGCLEGMA